METTLFKHIKYEQRHPNYIEYFGDSLDKLCNLLEYMLFSLFGKLVKFVMLELLKGIQFGDFKWIPAYISNKVGAD